MAGTILLLFLLSIPFTAGKTLFSTDFSSFPNAVLDGHAALGGTKRHFLTIAERKSNSWGTAMLKIKPGRFPTVRFNLFFGGGTSLDGPDNSVLTFSYGKLSARRSGTSDIQRLQQGVLVQFTLDSMSIFAAGGKLLKSVPFSTYVSSVNGLQNPWLPVQFSFRAMDKKSTASVFWGKSVELPNVTLPSFNVSNDWLLTWSARSSDSGDNIRIDGLQVSIETGAVPATLVFVGRIDLPTGLYSKAIVNAVAFCARGPPYAFKRVQVSYRAGTPRGRRLLDDDSSVGTVIVEMVMATTNKTDAVELGVNFQTAVTTGTFTEALTTSFQNVTFNGTVVSPPEVYSVQLAPEIADALKAGPAVEVKTAFPRNIKRQNKTALATQKASTRAPTRIPTDIPTPTPSPSVSASPSPTATSTDSPTSSPTQTPTATRTSSTTRTSSATASVSPTRSPSASPLPTDSPSASPTKTPTRSPTNSPTSSPTATPTTSPTASPTDSPTSSTSPTATPTASLLPTPGPICPSDARSQRSSVGSVFICFCSAVTSGGSVWGSNPYTDDSALCKAVRHSGLHVPHPVFTDYWRVKYLVSGNQSSFMGSTQNGITTKSTKRWPGSFTILNQAPPSETPSAAPTASVTRTAQSESPSGAPTASAIGTAASPSTATRTVAPTPTDLPTSTEIPTEVPTPVDVDPGSVDQNGCYLAMAALDRAFINLPAMTFGVPSTIELWFILNAPPGMNARLFDFGGGPALDNIAMRINDTSSEAFLTVYNGTSLVLDEAVTPSLNISTWAHIAVVFDASAGTDGATTATVYVNGAEVSTVSMAGPEKTTRSTNYIGRSNWATDPYIDMNVLEFRVWNVERSAAEISASYGTTLPSCRSAPGLMFRLGLDQSSGEVVDSCSAETVPSTNTAWDCPDNGAGPGAATPCPTPVGWCSSSTASYRSVDCDGDGILDSFCIDTAADNAMIASGNSCTEETGVPFDDCPAAGPMPTPL